MTTGTVLLADDDRSIRMVLNQALTRIGCHVRTTGSVSTLWRWVEDGEGDVVVTDVMMPDGDALDLLPAIRRKRPELPVIVMSAQNTILTAIRAAEAGAYEYLPKPFDLREVLDHVRKALDGRDADRGSEAGQARVRDEGLPLIGRSPVMQDVYRIMARLMNTNLSVMITGESGVGKGLVARALHDFGQRKRRPFVTVNMATTPHDLIESTLFSQQRGAFAGPTERPVGKLEQAQGGTLFLDEIGDMPHDAQTRLLRVLQEGQFIAGDGETPVRSDVRIIAATQRDLRHLIHEGRFREDLFYRLNVVPLRLPPLRERVEDIPDLVHAFLLRAESEGLPRKAISREGLGVLAAQRWPGNVRELENLVKRLAALSADDLIDADAIGRELAARPSSAEGPRPVMGESLGAAIEHHLDRYFSLHGDTPPPPGLYGRIMREVELPLIALTLAATQGNQMKAADVLGINRNTLRKKIHELDIPVTRGKKLM
ncbi:nitrogen regulation protein NR(I) [Pikeienuella sp. HZG-20]|uniref:nitrogen regulation protein NR(I) n=1 Tax=Paludibacillus litoralis TaxID=3133267 RepID=UPI0030ED0209